MGFTKVHSIFGIAVTNPEMATEYSKFFLFMHQLFCVNFKDISLLLIVICFQQKCELEI